MELLWKRLYLKADYIIGCLSLTGTRFCDTLEDRVRDLNVGMKIPGETAILAGRDGISALVAIGERSGNWDFHLFSEL